MTEITFDNLSEDDKLRVLKDIKYVFTCGDDYNIHFDSLSEDAKLRMLEDIEYVFTCGDDYNIHLSNAARDCSGDDARAIEAAFKRAIEAQKRRLAVAT